MAEEEVKETEEVKEEVSEESIKDKMYPDKSEKDETPEDKKDEETKEEKKETDAEEEKETDAEEEKADDEEKSEDKSKEQEETKEEKEQELELTLSKDSPLNEESLEKMLEFAKENKLSNDEAQLYLELKEEGASEILDGQVTEKKAIVEKWDKDMKSHKEFGGDDYEEHQVISRKVLDRFDVDGELTKFFDETGLWNNPALFSFRHALGMAMSDDKFVDGKPKIVKQEKSMKENWYPNEVTKKE